MEKKAKLPELNFTTVVSNIKGFAIFMMDEDGIISTWNAGCELMKGFTSEDAIGKHYEMLFPDFLKEENMPQKELDEVRKNGRFETENWRTNKSGELFWAHVALSKVLDDEGNVIGYAKITQDHSEKKRLENELMKSKITLQKDLDGFIYTASHDLRSPISNMDGLLNSISDHECYRDEELNPLFDMMKQSVERLKKTITDLTEISIIQKAIRDDFQELSFKKLIDEVTFSVKDLVVNTKTRIEIDTDTCPVVKFSTKSLRSILYNLIINAIYYRSPDRAPEIFISTIEKDGCYILIVKDNGLGIKKENLGKIFLMFKRLHDHVQGAGIGLYMVKRIVDNAGGRVEVESELGKGTTFKIYLKAIN